MSKVALSGNASGTGIFTIASPNSNTDCTVTLPEITGTMAILGNTITSGTAVASTSGTSIDFTDIPASTKRITVMLNGVSTNGTAQWLIQLGDAGGIENTGYISEGGFIGATTGSTAQTTGFGIRITAATSVLQGSATICLVSGTTWVAQGLFAGSGSSAGFSYITSGSKTLSSTLDRIRITTTNGTDTFDAGSINILYE